MILGIDLGSTNTCAAVWDGKLRMIEFTEGGATSMPSVVCITPDEDYVGQAAVDMARQHPQYDLRNWKIRIAQKWHDDEDTGYQTCADKDGMLGYRGPDGTIYSPVDLAAYVLTATINAANAYLAPHDTVTGAVIGVPVTFDPEQVDGIKQAARFAGIENVTTLEEPVAAAIAAGIDAKKASCCIVVDFGGGTLDTTILRFGGGRISILAKNGIGDLGGVDFDKRIADFAINLFRTENRKDGEDGGDIVLGEGAMNRIMAEAEATKKRLSDREETTFRLDNISRTGKGVSLHMIYKITRPILAELTRDLHERIISACKATIDDAKRLDSKFSAADIKEVLCVGGMTRVPSVRQTIADFFGKAPRKDENPEQIVAQGCAIKAAIIEGRRPDVSLADITSHDIAIETANNVPAIIIPRGTPFPMKAKTFRLRNADDDQGEISLRLLYATRPRASDCHVLDARDLAIDPCPAETREIQLVLEVDDEGHPSIVSAA
jgi:molecular chaperone DnaK